MQIGSSPTQNYNAYKSPSDNLGVSQNRQKDIAEQNAKTGGDYSYDKEVSAANAQLVLNIVV